MKKRVIIGIGSNLGDKRAFCKQAVREIAQLDQTDVLSLSSFYDSGALLLPNSPKEWNIPFLNFALLGETTLSPVDLLHQLKAIEKKMGRINAERWSPRVIDLDILAYDMDMIEKDALKIPHPHLHERSFAYLPFLELWPTWEHPRMQRQLRDCIKKEVAQAQRSATQWSQWIGIVNVTLDSFSDGGCFFSQESALSHIQSLMSAGAAIVDIGAESTRPGAECVLPELEWKRLQPILKEVQKGNIQIPLSLDTRHPEIIRRGCDVAAIQFWNDVSAGQDSFEETIEVLTSYPHLKYVLMHSLGIPPRRDLVISSELPLIGELLRWANEKIEIFTRAGIEKHRLIFDPGIGFGKTPQQNLTLLREIRSFQALGLEVLVGHSRKSFLSQWVEKPAQERDVETLALSQHLVRNQVDYIRVHNVEWHSRFQKVERAFL